MGIRIVLDLPESALSSLRTTPDRFAGELRMAAAAKWCEMHLLSQSKASEIAGVSRQEFLSALGRFGVSVVQMTPGELEQETNLE
jgi:predicted HTH domain antitoxin